MAGWSRLSRVLLVVVICGMVGVALLSFRALNADLRSYRQADAASLHWTVSRVEAELSLLLAAMSAEGTRSARDPAVAGQRDMVLTFAELARGGAGVLPGPDGSALRAKLDRLAALIMAPQAGASADATDPIAALTKIQGELGVVSATLLADEIGRSQSLRESLRSEGRIAFLTICAVLTLAMILVAVLLIETRRARRTMQQLEVLASRARAADRAKSRFLSMMSHELRTPMNGVMGIIALLKQSGLDTRQKRLIGQAEQSGADLIDLLGDILDYAEVEAETIRTDRRPFQTRFLCRVLAHDLDPVARRHGVEVEIAMLPEVPEIVLGDFARKKKVIAQLASFLLDRAGGSDAAITLSHDGHNLVAEIAIMVDPDDELEWLSNLISARAPWQGDGSDTQDIGSIIARRITLAMDGEIEFVRRIPEQAALRLAIPASPADPVQDHVVIASDSRTTRLMLHSATTELNFGIWHEGIADERVMAVLIEATGERADQRLRDVAERFIAARHVAIGQPRNPELYDAVLEQPLDLMILRNVLTAADMSLSGGAPILPMLGGKGMET